MVSKQIQMIKMVSMCLVVLCGIYLHDNDDDGKNDDDDDDYNKNDGIEVLNCV